MTDLLTSRDLWIPLVSIILFLFLSSRLYSLKNVAFDKQNTEFNLAFVLGHIVTKIDMLLVLAYLIINFIHGNYLKPIIIALLGLSIGGLLARNISLPPSTAVSNQTMTFACILIIGTFIVFSIYVYRLI